MRESFGTWRWELEARGHAVGEAFIDDGGRLFVIIDDTPRNSREIKHLLMTTAWRSKPQIPDIELVTST